MTHGSEAETKVFGVCVGGGGMWGGGQGMVCGVAMMLVRKHLEGVRLNALMGRGVEKAGVGMLKAKWMWNGSDI